MFVAVLVIVTSTPARMALLESETTPEMKPRVS
jgi:hypothetical protein